MSSRSISAAIITDKIILIRGHKVMVDRDLALLYGVATRRLNEQVKRNIKRFPPDFMFQMTKVEFDDWKSHFATSNRDKMGLRKRPLVFTQEGVAMLSGVLHSARAVLVNVAIMRAFVKLRETLFLHKELAARLKELESKVEGHDKDIHAVFEAIRRLMKEEEQPKGKIGFHP